MKSGTKEALLAGLGGGEEAGEGEGVGEGERADVGEEIRLGDLAVVDEASFWSPDR